MDTWLADHERPDDPDAPLFHGIRPQDDPSEHLHPHSIHQQLKRIAKRTDGVDATNISPHTFKHGRASEMRASDKYSKDDVEQILDWEEGTPMHGRYEHVTEVDEAERILRKHGHEPTEGGDAVEQHDCPRCGTKVDQSADYCPTCSLRQQDGLPRWWRIYKEIAAEDDPVRQQYMDDLAPASLSQLSPGYYEHVLDVFTLALVQNAVDEVSVEGQPIDEMDVSVSGVPDDPAIDEEDIEWLREHYPEIEERHLEQHPSSLELRGD